MDLVQFVLKRRMCQQYVWVAWSCLSWVELSYIGMSRDRRRSQNLCIGKRGLRPPILANFWVQDKCFGWNYFFAGGEFSLLGKIHQQILTLVWICGRAVRGGMYSCRLHLLSINYSSDCLLAQCPIQATIICIFVQMYLSNVKNVFV